MIDELNESASTPEFELPVKCAELLVRACHAGFFEETQPPGGHAMRMLRADSARLAVRH
jgi:hypothetical protein